MTDDSTSTSNAPVVFKGGIAVAKTVTCADLDCNTVTASSVDASTISIGGIPINLSNFVTTNTNQTITGNKIFSGEVQITSSYPGANPVIFGRTEDGEIKFGSYGGGANRIRGGYFTDIYDTHYLQFYSRGELCLEIRNSFTGSGVRKELRLPNEGGIIFDGGSKLTYYKTQNLSGSWRRNNSSGSVITSFTGKITRIGRIVTITLDELAFSVPSPAATLYCADIIPAEYRPPVGMSYAQMAPCRYNSSAINSQYFAVANAMSDGSIVVDVLGPGSFVGFLGGSGYLSITITYQV